MTDEMLKYFFYQNNNMNNLHLSLTKKLFVLRNQKNLIDVTKKVNLIFKRIDNLLEEPVIRNTNDGLKYMYNALNYVTYGHTDYDKRYSLNTDIDNAYEQFLAVKNYFYKTSGNFVFHFVVVYNAKTTL